MSKLATYLWDLLACPYRLAVYTYYHWRVRRAWRELMEMIESHGGLPAPRGKAKE